MDYETVILSFILFISFYLTNLISNDFFICTRLTMKIHNQLRQDPVLIRKH